MKTTQDNKTERTVTLLFHTISYYYGNGMEMPESEEEHVVYMITQGYREGELCYMGDNDTEQRGWWRIDFGAI